MARPYQALRKSTLCILAEDVIGSKPIPSHYYFEKKAPKISDPIVFMLFFGIFRNGGKQTFNWATPVFAKPWAVAPDVTAKRKRKEQKDWL